ncbi:MAG: PQQ-binding-like beta-propeller repeat protein, partial [Ferruginibacter sp.]
MKKIITICCFILYSLVSVAQTKAFRFAFISDTHIGSPDGKAEQDLQRTINDINKRTDIDFVVITGDITELGTDTQLATAKKLLDVLKIKWYIIPGNHDAGWSESGGQSYVSTFGSDRFCFDHNGTRFLACASGPYVRMSDGHIPRDAMNWMKKVLDTTNINMPVVFLNHYPMDNQMDNWYEVIDALKKRNCILIMCGHGHTNKSLNFEDIPGVMGRSNLRAKKEVGGYNMVDMGMDSILFSETNPVTAVLRQWTSVKNENHHYDLSKKYPRPAYDINRTYSTIKEKWRYSADANIISTPAVINDLVVFGDQQGKMMALSIANGKPRWFYKTSGSIFSSPAVWKENIVFGSADGNIYCLNNKGKLNWKLKTGAAVLGSPLIEGNTVFIGGSDHTFRAIDIRSGKALWSFNGLDGPVVSNPVIANDKIIFGAWDTYLYSLDKNNGKLNWKWSNGSSVRNFSPASCTPVIHNGIVYIVAPDRYLSAIDISTGKTLWRSNEAAVRESIGISEDSSLVYGKTMTDTLVAFPTSGTMQKASWKMNVGYGYEHVPSMLIEKNG